MIAPPPHIPGNLGRKLIVATKVFQRDYDATTLAEARRLLARHNLRMPVLCSFDLYGNGKLRQVNLCENLKRKEPSSCQFATSVNILNSPEQCAIDLHSASLCWIAENAAKQFLTERRHQAFRLRDDEIAAFLRIVPKYASHLSVYCGDVSLLAIRRILEKEHELRCGESNHARLVRYSQQMPPGLIRVLEEERETALIWWNEKNSEGYAPYNHFKDRGWPKEESIILLYRERCCMNAFR